MSERKVAIVGGAGTRTKAPYRDERWEIWAFSSLRLKTPRITRWFEMHAIGDLESQLIRQTKRRWSFERYFSFLSSLECPIYMQRPHESLPTSVGYPLDSVLGAFGRCFTSTASYMIALAMLEEVGTIGVWGVHLTEKRVYAKQRPAILYLLALARRRGMDVVIAPGSPLRVPKRPVFPETDILYGYDWQSPKAWWRPKRRHGESGTKKVRRQRT